MCAVSLTASSATAKVYVDPDSAPGKEYEVPLDRVRNDAAPGGGTTGQPPGSGQAPAFGVGLSPTSDDEAAAGKGGDGDGKRGDGDGKRGDPAGSDTPAAGGNAPEGPSSAGDAQVAVRQAGSSEGGIGPTLTFSALGIGTLLLGGAVGLMLRRRTRQQAL
jgi:hypothetical protein